MSVPFKSGDWAMCDDGWGTPLFGKVKACYLDRSLEGEEFLVDLVAYAPDGSRIGRRSPACGGPTSFEPALTAKNLKRIEEPVFPLKVGRFIKSYDHLLKPI